MGKMTLGEYIRVLRIQNGLTQASLAEMLHITDKAVSKWERDISYPDISLFPRLADILGVTVSDLLRVCVDEHPASILRQFVRMSPDIRTPIHIILGCADLIKGAADGGIHACQKLFHTERFGNVVVSTNSETFQLVSL